MGGRETKRAFVLLWQSVARAVDDSNELWDGIKKVDDLRNEEKQQRLAKVAQNATLTRAKTSNTP